MLRKEVNVLVVNEEGVHLVRMCQYVSAPAVQHGDLEEGRQVLCLVLQEKVTRCLVEKPLVPVGLPQFVIQMPVLAGGPDAPLGDPKQCGHLICH